MNPDPVFKSVIDWTIWIAGLGISIWGIYKMTPELHDLEQFIAQKKAFRKARPRHDLKRPRAKLGE